MRKSLVLALTIVSTLFASAEETQLDTLQNIDVEKYISVKCAEKSELQMAAMTLGTMSGNPLLGGFLGAQLNDFDPAHNGLEIDPTLKNGEIARVSVQGELFDYIFDAQENLKKYKGAVKSASIVYIVTKLGIDAKVEADYTELCKDDIAKLSSFNPSVFDLLAPETIAFLKFGDYDFKLFTVDSLKMVEKVAQLCEKKPEELDWEKKGEEFAASLRDSLENKSPALAFKGYIPPKPAFERFAATFPEYKNTELKAAGFVSVYSLFKTLLPVYISVAKDQDLKTMLTMFMMQLPEEGVGGLGFVITSSEAGKLVAHYRISADEVKAIAGAGNAVFMMAMMNGGMNGGLIEDDSEDEDPCCDESIYEYEEEIQLED